MITCCVRKAISAAFSLGRASTSSKALVCNGSWSRRGRRPSPRPRYGPHCCQAAGPSARPGGLGVEAQPLGPLRSSRRERSRIHPPDTACGAEPRFPRRSRRGRRRRKQARCETVDIRPQDVELHVAQTVGERECEFLRGGRSPASDVVPGRSAAAGRDVRGAVLIRSPIRLRCSSGRKNHSFCAMYSLEDVGLQGPSRSCDALPLGCHRYIVRRSAPQVRRWSSTWSCPQRNAVEEHLHVGGRVDRDPQWPTSPELRGSSGRGPSASACRTRRSRTAAAGSEQHLVSLVGLLRVAAKPANCRIVQGRPGIRSDTAPGEGILHRASQSSQARRGLRGGVQQVDFHP